MRLAGTYLMTLDAGTGSGRCIIFDLEGNQIAMAQQEWLCHSLPAYPGSQVFDTGENWRVLASCISKAIQKARISPYEIAGIGATSMREGFVLYDRNGKEIWACPNTDARAKDEAEELINRGLGPKIYKVGGDWFGMIAPPRLLWIKKHEPEIYNHIAHLTMISDWILYKLSGEFVTEPSIGSSSGLFNLSTRSWSQETIEICELPRDIYPTVVESGSIVGRVTKEAATETGLVEGTPVVACGADTQLALLGVGAIKSLDYTVVAGSFWQTTVIVDEPLVDPECRPRTLCHVLPNEWMIEGIGFLHGIAMRWFRDSFCQEEKSRAAQQGVDVYSILERLAEQVPPGSNGVLAIFSNVMNAKRWKHASPSFVQLDIMSPEACGKKEFVRALEESAAYVTYGNLQNLISLTGVMPREIVFCGGSSKGFLWPQIVADVLGVNVRVPVVKESTALGAMICVGKAVGAYNSIEEAVSKLVNWERIHQPNIQNHHIYKHLYEQWKKVYKWCLEMVDEELLRPMWRAPGT